MPATNRIKSNVSDIRVQNRSGWLDFGRELVVDLFAGGGGASLGISRAYRQPDLAVNHNSTAIAVHQANHPSTLHFTSDVFEVDPVIATGGRPVGVLWASPDCRHHSKAKGGKPRSKKIRGLAWVVIKWAAAVRPRLIHLENVTEFQDWCRLTPEGKPCPKRKGETFRRWVRELERLGYRVEWKELVAASYGAPTIRRRLYIVARCDGRPIVWPAPTHSSTGENGLPRWRAAADCIDWSIPAHSIFDRKKPLADNTQRRIAKGLWRYVLNCADPFIVPLRGTSDAHTSTHAIHDPLSTITGGGTHHALVAPHITKFRANSVGSSLRDPLHTITAGGAMRRPAGAAHAMGMVSAAMVRSRARSAPAEAERSPAVAAPFFEQANGGFYDGDGRSADTPLSTICTSGANQRLVSAYLLKLYGSGGQWSGCDEPVHTIPTRDRMAVVRAIQMPADCLPPALAARAKACAQLLHRYLPEHFPECADLVLVGDHVLADITLRMLTPKELAKAQGFPDDYVLDRGADGRQVNKTDQVKLIGNSVVPAVAQALIEANAADLIRHYQREAA